MSKQLIQMDPILLEDYDETVDFLENRHTEKYMIRGIDAITIEGTDVFIDFKLSDENSASTFSKHIFVPRYAFSHLAHFIGIPGRALDYFVSLNALNNNQSEIAIANESDHLSALFERRLNNENNRDIYIHITEDGFGKFARCISSDQYIHYEDEECIKDFNELIENHNSSEQNGEYEFTMARLTPYESLFGYANEHGEIHGDEISAGISMRNSESKKRSVHFMNMLIRLICTNGLYSRDGGGRDIKIPHTGENFDNQRSDAFLTVIDSQNKFWDKFKSLEQYDRLLSEDWNDFLEFPSKYLPMRKGDKKDLIEAAEMEGYEFSVWGLINALTYIATHKTDSQRKSDLYNKKTMKIADYAHEINDLEFPIPEDA